MRMRRIAAPKMAAKLSSLAAYLIASKKRRNIVATEITVL